MMEKMRRFLFPMAMALLMGLLYLFDGAAGTKAVDTTLYSFKEMVMIIPPVFVLLGLLDVWVPRETMIRFMGKGSGILGVLLSVVLGSAAAGPLYAAFPVAAVFMKKGAGFTNVMVFIGAWSTTKIPMLLFETASMGLKFTLTRLLMSFIGIFAISLAISKAMKPEEVEKVYEAAKEMK